MLWWPQLDEERQGGAPRGLCCMHLQGELPCPLHTHTQRERERREREAHAHQLQILTPFPKSTAVVDCQRIATCTSYTVISKMTPEKIQPILTVAMSFNSTGRLLLATRSNLLLNSVYLTQRYAWEPPRTERGR
jgi:hypothetical protein